MKLIYRGIAHKSFSSTVASQTSTLQGQFLGMPYPIVATEEVGMQPPQASLNATRKFRGVPY
jgi:hypothetical protein